MAIIITIFPCLYIWYLQQELLVIGTFTYFDQYYFSLYPKSVS